MAYSIKPGRGPSLSGGVAGLVAAVFGVFWTIGAVSLFRNDMAGGPPAAFQALFVLFGVAFVLLGLAGAAYNFYNAGARNRMSTLDITRAGDEPDPIATALGHEPRHPQPTSPDPAHDRFCPHCGQGLARGFKFCPRCGKPAAP